MEAGALNKGTENLFSYPAENEVTGYVQWVTFKPFATPLSPMDLEQRYIWHTFHSRQGSGEQRKKKKSFSFLQVHKKKKKKESQCYKRYDYNTVEEIKVFLLHLFHLFFALVWFPLLTIWGTWLGKKVKDQVICRFPRESLWGKMKAFTTVKKKNLLIS